MVDYISYVGPYKERSAFWGDNNLESPILYSRLSVGNPFLSKIEGNKIANQIGYGEAGTMNDYMLVAQNDVKIPARYNSKRNDIFLTMRGTPFFGNSILGVQMFLEVTDNGKIVNSSENNPKKYIDMNAKMTYTPFLLKHFPKKYHSVVQ